MRMGDVIRFRPRKPSPPVPDTRVRIAGALALALDAVDRLVDVLDDLDGGVAEPAVPENRGGCVVWLQGDHGSEDV